MTAEAIKHGPEQITPESQNLGLTQDIAERCKRLGITQIYLINPNFNFVATAAFQQTEPLSKDANISSSEELRHVAQEIGIDFSAFLSKFGLRAVLTQDQYDPNSFGINTQYGGIASVRIQEKVIILSEPISRSREDLPYPYIGKVIENVGNPELGNTYVEQYALRFGELSTQSAKILL